MKSRYQQIREKYLAAKQVGCLPADNCMFDGDTHRCVICSRLVAEKPSHIYHEKWQAKTDAIEDIPFLLARCNELEDALRDLMGAMAKTTVYTGVQYGKTHLANAFNKAREVLEKEVKG